VITDWKEVSCLDTPKKASAKLVQSVEADDMVDYEEVVF